MATMYAQPAAANFYAPAAQAHFAPKSRGYRLCDTCGAVENPLVAKFRLCGGCMTTQYCSGDCQKSHWPSHKSICQHTASQIASAKAPGTGYPEENLAKHLRKFTSAHQSLLNWAGFQALQLKRSPANIRTHALLVELDFNPSASSSADSLHRFAVSRCSLVPRTYITSRDPLVAADIERREARCCAAGGIGALVILIQCGGISQVMPVEVDPPASISWDERADWEPVLRKFVADGRTDFMPISTTSRGVFYG